MRDYLEEKGYNLATVDSSGLLGAGVQQVSRLDPSVRDALVVAKQPHKDVWRCVLWLHVKIVRANMGYART